MQEPSEDTPTFEIAEAEPADAPDILSLVHRAFAEVAAEYGVDTLPPMRDTLPDLIAEFRSHVILKAVANGRIVGSVRAATFHGTCEVGRLVVEPGMQGLGIGTALAREIERRCPEAERFELFTGHRSGGPLHIYGKLGYVPFRVEPVSAELQLIYLEKSPKGKETSDGRRR